MTAKDIVSGVGARYAEAFKLNTQTGLPDCAFNLGTLTAGTIIEGIKTFTYNNPAAQRIQHYGDDRTFAQDSLPPTSVGDLSIVTAKTNLSLDTFTEGTKEVTIDGVVKARAGNTDNRGSEPQMFMNVYRQALDTQNGSATFGKLRQWHSALIPSLRIINNLQGFEQAASNKTYEGIPTPVSQTPWGQTFDQNTWGAQRGEYIEMTTDYKPVWNVGLGNGTLTTFALTKPPVDLAHCHVFLNGTLTAISSYNGSTTAPKITFGSAPGGAGSGGQGPLGESFIAVQIEHSQSS